MRAALIEKIESQLHTDELDLSHLKIQDNEIDNIMKKIINNQSNIFVISFDNNNLSDIGADKLAHYLEHFTHLKELSLQFNRIDKIGAIALFSLKKNLPELNILFHGNKIIDVNDMAEIEAQALGYRCKM